MVCRGRDSSAKYYQNKVHCAIFLQGRHLNSNDIGFGFVTGGCGTIHHEPSPLLHLPSQVGFAVQMALALHRLPSNHWRSVIDSSLLLLQDKII